jgi:thioredoxin reductase (NADPH)
MKFGLKHEMVEAQRVSVNNDKTFTILLAGNKSVDALSVILATGSVPKRANFKGEDEFFGKGVSTCATCDGFFYKDKEVAVLGGGDTALEEALYLANICSKVYLIHRRDTFRASPATIERVEKNDKIELLLNSSVDEVKGDAMGVTSVDVKSADGIRTLEVPGIFVFVGRDVLNSSLRDEDGNYICAVNKSGEIIVDLSMNTSIEGLYAAGDVRIQAPKQVVCAAGDGATAALQAIAYVEHKKG